MSLQIYTIVLNISFRDRTAAMRTRVAAITPAGMQCYDVPANRQYTNNKPCCPDNCIVPGRVRSGGRELTQAIGQHTH